VEREFGVAWDAEARQTWQAACDALVASALAQPTVAMLRDYMPRNLMVTPENNPGILDFQDAVRGPISYDLASLLRDAFITWEEEQEIDWAVRYWEAARKAGLALPDDFGEFWRQVEWMGLQRHLKVLGIFCRLKHRDGKPAYSADLPRFFNYAHKVASRYNALRPLSRLLEPLMGAERIEVFN
jgi:N-acetylmuramate 1-kinase